MQVYHFNSRLWSFNYQIWQSIPVEIQILSKSTFKIKFKTQLYKLIYRREVNLLLFWIHLINWSAYNLISGQTGLALLSVDYNANWWPAMFSLIFCALCAQKFWRVRTFSGKSPRIKTVFESEIRWRPENEKEKKRSSPKDGAVFVSKKCFACLITVNLWSTTLCLCNNTSVRSKFMRVRSVWNLCALAHAHSLEGTLTTSKSVAAQIDDPKKILLHSLSLQSCS